MPRQDQSATIRAPQNRQGLEALIEQRNEMQGQLRALEDRRFQLADQAARLDGELARDVQRRVKSLDASIDRLERQIATANELITAGHARFGGQPVEVEIVPAPAAPPAPPAEPALPAPFIEVHPAPPASEFIIGRALLVEGVGFVLLGAVFWLFAKRRLERRLAGRTGTGDQGIQMTQLQQSVDAIALEVERISENQRWVTKVLHDKALGAGDARPVDVAAGDREPARRQQ